MPLIMPIKDLRNTSEISSIAHREQEPVFITKNGYSDLVVMSSELYEKLATENVMGQVDRIKKSILSLGTFPRSHQERSEGRYAGRGYRRKNTCYAGESGMLQLTAINLQWYNKKIYYFGSNNVKEKDG